MPTCRRGVLLKYCAALAVAVAMLPLSLSAQTETGSIAGQVTDPSGRVVVGATLKLVDIQHNATSTVQTNRSGFYRFAGIAPGMYRLDVEHAGFRTANVTGITLNTQDDREENIHLTVGSVSESVTVVANGVQVNTSDASISTVIDQEFVKNIPLNGRSFQSLLLLTPGMVFSTGEQGQLSVNGGRTDANSFTVDGVSGNIGVGVQSLYDQSASGAIPGFNSFGGTQNLLSLDAMEEVKISTSTYSAEYGRQPGAQVSLVSKGGTKTLHGTVYDYLRNSATDANDWFSDELGVKKVPSRQNDFGGAIGGPIWIPKIYDGREHGSFFFFDYEGLRLALPQPSRAFSVPAACLHGNATLNHQLQELVDAFPLPNTLMGTCAGTATTNGSYTTGYDNYTNMNTEAIRLDQTINPKLTIFLRADHSKSQGDIYTLGKDSSYPLRTDTETLGVDSQFTSSLSNAFRLNFSVLSYPQRGKLNLNFFLTYNSEQWHLKLLTTAKNGEKIYKYFWGPPPLAPVCAGGGAGISLVGSEGVCMGENVTALSNGDGTSNTYTTYVVGDPLGGVHQMAQMATGGYNYISVDGSGYQMSGDPSMGTAQVIDSSGTVLPQETDSEAVIAQDSNGNQIKSSASTITDSAGRSISFATTTASTTGCPTGSTSASSFTVPSFNNGTTSTSTYTYCYETETFTTDFPVNTNNAAINYAQGSAQESVMTGFILPNGTSWSFAYDSWGNLNKVTLPTGGTISYVWTQVEVYDPSGQNLSVFNQVVKSRTLNANDGSAVSTWNYTIAPAALATVTDPLGNDTVHTFGESTGTGSEGYETEADYYQGSHTSGTKLKTVVTAYANATDSPTDYTGNILAYVFPTSVTTTWANGQASTITKTYDSGAVAYQSAVNQLYGYNYTAPFFYGKVLNESVYDYGAYPNGSPIKQTVTAYAWQSNTSFLEANLLNLPTAVQVKNGAGSLCSETDYAYDNASYLQSTSGITQHVSVSGERGNLSSASQLYSMGPCTSSTLPSATPATSYSYIYDTGMPYKSVDPGSHTTTFGYDSTGGLLTSTTNALGQSVGAAYDANTGLMTSFKDLNGSVTGAASTFGYDNMGRLKTAAYPDGGNSTFTYMDSTNEVERTEAICNGCGNSATIYVLFDGLGRQQRSEQQNANASNPYDQSDTCYDTLGRVSFSTYAYQGAGFGGTSRVCPGSGTTLAGDSQTFDALSRPLVTTHSDGTTASVSYTGRATETQDEGHPGASGTVYTQKISQPDALGRLLSVCEISATTYGAQSPASCGLDISGTGFLTTYAYDPMGDLQSVQQAGMPNRAFTYDSLSRLMSAYNPESGTTSYTYNLDSVLQTKTDGQGNVINYSPAASPTDGLHRVTEKTYTLPGTTAATPTVTYAYDSSSLCSSSGGNCIGHLVAESTLNSSNAAIVSKTMYKFDSMERLQAQRTCLYGQCGASPTWREQDYTYDYLGSMLTGTDGAGNSYAWTPNVEDRPQTMTASYSTSALLSNMAYGAFGLTSASLGNGHVLAHGYDTRGRLQSLTDGVSGSTPVYSDSVTYAADSDVSSAVDSVTGSWSYTYDEFNRATKAAASTGSGWAAGLTLAWGYDRYGNRLSQTATGTSSIPVSQPTIAVTDNRINGYCYDGGGRLEDLGTCAASHQYVYDGEGRIATTAGVTYVYDAEGKRAAKLSGTTLSAAYLYDAGGDQVAELNGSYSVVHANVFLGSLLSATWTPSGGVSYEYADLLGTKRYQTNSTGIYQNSWGSLPFGDSLTALGSGSDATEHHFTGKEHDAESGLDFFGARYYAENMGRWMSPDWSVAVEPVPYAKLGDPQSLNLYNYVRNNPIAVVDADGHDDDSGDSGSTGSSSGHGAAWDNFDDNVTAAAGADAAQFILGNMGIGGTELQASQSRVAQQQTQYGKQADGSYKADPAAVKKAIAGGKAIGSGECVALCRFLSGAPNSGTWTAGQHAAGLTDADIGTAIATFDSSGHYPSDNDPLGKNSAIFMGRGAQGSIWVVDQWPVGDGPPGTHQPFLHEIRNYAPDNTVHPLRSNNADAYYVIRVP
jgi:RHS repeat-associated protein